jgi:hypothetical protein
MGSSQRFSIDEARQPFDVDMASKIRVVEEAGRALIVAPGCSGAAEALAQACRSIAHSSALVGARSLDATARLLASLAEAATPDLGSACVEGAEAMRTMLGLELRNLGHEAWGLAVELRERASRSPEAREAIARGGMPKPPSVDAFSFDDEPRLATDPGVRARMLLFPRRGPL